MIKQPHNISQVGVGREGGMNNLTAIAPASGVVPAGLQLFDDSFIKENRQLGIQFLNYCKEQLNYSESTMKDYRCLLHLYELYLGNTDVRTLQIFDIHNYFAERLKRNKQDSVNRDRSVLRAFFTYVDKVKRIRLDFDCSMIRNAKTDDPVTKFVTVEQFNYILSKIDGEQDRLVLAAMFGGALRISEIVKLSPDWIGEGELRIKGKGGKRRVVPVPVDLTDALRNFAYDQGISHGPIFRHQVTKRTLINDGYTPNGLRKRLHRLLAPYGININPHAYRHGMATVLATNGIDVRNLQLYLGHKRIDTTQRYWHVTNPTLRKNVMAHFPDDIKFNLLGG